MQNILVLVAVLGCVSFIAWQAVLSLRGRKSKLNGCGTCGGCATTPTPPTATPTPRVQILPADMLRRRR